MQSLRRATLCYSMLTIVLCSVTGHTEKLLPDSSNFVRASLMVASPADEIYSVYGHCALRMECPSKQLDYIFSLETDIDAGSYLRYFAGKAMARVVAVPTQQYLSQYRSSGREVVLYELNLNLHEKQRLWQMLDEEMMKEPYLRFNLITTNCVTLCTVMLEQSLKDERFRFEKIPAPMALDNGALMRYHARRSPWAEFLFITFIGGVSDQTYDMKYRLSPEMIVDIMQNTVIEDSLGNTRPALKGHGKVALPLTKAASSAAITPLMTFICLLLWVILLTLLEWRKGWHRLPHIIDLSLFIFQTVTGLLLLYIATVTNLFDTRWNWYLIPFNPLPLLLWLCFHKRSWYPRLYICYAAILLLFATSTPLSSQLDAPHAFIVLTMAVRCISKYLTSNGLKNKNHTISLKES